MSNIFSAVCTCTKDAEQRHLQSGSAVLSVNVANNQGFGDKKKTMFIRVTIFGKRAEGNLKEFLTKGQQVFLSGELSISEYEAKDGSTKTNLELNANVIDLVGKRNDQQSRPESKPKPQTEDYDDDIPF